MGIVAKAKEVVKVADAIKKVIDILNPEIRPHLVTRKHLRCPVGSHD
jgi:hypothetical protein